MRRKVAIVLAVALGVNMASGPSQDREEEPDMINPEHDVVVEYCIP